MRHLPALAAAFALLVPVAAHASVETDTKDIDSLVTAFHASLASHDGPRLLSLFVPTGSAWFSAPTDEAFAALRLKKPDAVKLRPGSPQDFAAFVSGSKARIEEPYRDMKVLSDGTIAVVYFDFDFLADGRKKNTGTESWQLIRDTGGWRIVSLVYSSAPAR